MTSEHFLNVPLVAFFIMVGESGVGKSPARNASWRALTAVIKFVRKHREDLPQALVDRCAFSCTLAAPRLTAPRFLALQVPRASRRDHARRVGGRHYGSSQAVAIHDAEGGAPHRRALRPDGALEPGEPALEPGAPTLSLPRLCLPPPLPSSPLPSSPHLSSSLRRITSLASQSKSGGAPTEMSLFLTLHQAFGIGKSVEKNACKFDEAHVQACFGGQLGVTSELFGLGTSSGAPKGAPQRAGVGLAQRLVGVFGSRVSMKYFEYAEGDDTEDEEVQDDFAEHGRPLAPPPDHPPLHPPLL